jgi:hypothetical protein
LQRANFGSMSNNRLPGQGQFRFASSQRTATVVSFGVLAEWTQFLASGVVVKRLSLLLADHPRTRFWASGAVPGVGY